MIIFIIHSNSISAAIHSVKSSIIIQLFKLKIKLPLIWISSFPEHIFIQQLIWEDNTKQKTENMRKIMITDWYSQSLVFVTCIDPSLSCLTITTLVCSGAPFNRMYIFPFLVQVVSILFCCLRIQLFQAISVFFFVIYLFTKPPVPLRFFLSVSTLQSWDSC